MKFFKYIVLLVIAGSLTSASVHKFYVGVFQLDYVPEKKVVRMTARIFVDDLEKTLNKRYNTTLYIGADRESAKANEYIEKYLFEKIKITINGSPVILKFLGREMEDDILICYYTMPAISGVKSVKVNNTILFESFEEQQNIIHANINRNRKSLLLTNDKQQGQLDF